MSFQKSDSIKNIASALCCFQSKMGTISKDKSNPFFKSKYATLSNILTEIQQPLSECGISFSQFPDGDNSLTTIVMHNESGEWMQSTYCMKPVKEDPQALGSAITYARRYALGAILGLNIDEDDDGNAATHASGTQKTDDRPWLNDKTPQWAEALKFLTNGGTIDKIKLKYRISKEGEKKLIDATLQSA